MELIKSKPLSSLIFIPLSSLIFIRPFFSGLAYPTFEFYYENCVIFLAVITFQKIFYSLKAGFQSEGNLPFTPLDSNHLTGFRVSSQYSFPIFLLLCSYIISTIFSLNLQNSIKETIKFISYVSMFFMVSQADDKQKKTLIKIIVSSAAIISLYAIYQYFWGYENTLNFLKKVNPEFLTTSQYARDILIAKRSIGTFPSPNLFGGYLIITFFLALNSLKAVFQKVGNLPFRVSLESIPLITITFALVLTKSMGAWLSLVLGLIFFLVLIRPHLGLILSNYSKKRLNAILILVFISIFLILSFILINRWDRLMNLQNPQNSITQRLNYWRTALVIIKDRPLLGVGPGNFYLAYPKYKIGLSTDTRYAHNLFLHLWSENGLLGVVSVIFLAFLFLKKAKKDTPFCIALFTSGLTFLFHNLIDNTYLIPEVGLFLWIILGLVC